VAELKYKKEWRKFLLESEEDLEKHPHYKEGKHLHRDKYKKSDEQEEWKPELFEIEELGSIGKFKICLVKGALIRRLIDPNWVDGGNPARDIFIPMYKIWIEDNTKFEDLPCYIVHEYTEFYGMRDRGMTYDDAHENIANKWEEEIRDRQEEWKGTDAIKIAFEFLKEKKLIKND